MGGIKTTKTEYIILMLKSISSHKTKLQVELKNNFKFSWNRHTKDQSKEMRNGF